MIRIQAALLAVLAVPCPALAQSDDLLPPGQFLADEGHLILTHTDVRGHVAAGLAVVDVVQTFTNPFDQAIDATYVFPLPTEAAVRDMAVTCGERVIHAEIARREEATARFEAARAEGRRAALLEQQRDNVFTQHVAGLCPGETVEVALQYVEQLPIEADVTTFVFPTTLGPRFDPGDLREPPHVPSTRSGRDLAVHLTIDEGLPVESVWSDTFPITVIGEDDRSADVVLTETDALPNQDLHLAWTLAGRGPRVGAVVGAPREGETRGYVALTLQPQVLGDIARQRKRELLFVLDSSCSMRGAPWEAATDTVELALSRMEPDDTFNLVKFSDVAGSIFPEPAPATEANVERARAWLRHFRGGGTRMSEGVRYSLDQPGDPEALRLVLLLTDGYIGGEAEFFGVVRDHLSANDRIFALGIGSSPNRLLIDGLAHHGRGAAAYQLPATPIDETVRRFYERIAHPAMTDVEVDWGDLAVSDVQPARLPDLFAGQPIRVVARAPADTRGLIEIRGRVDGEPHTLRLPVSLAGARTHEAVSTLWARRRIADLSWDLDRDPDDVQSAIVDVALSHHLVSAHTSLVAVDDVANACGPARDGVDVPQLLPVGMDARFAKGGGQIGFGGLGTRGSGVGGGGTAVGLGSGRGGGVTPQSHNKGAGYGGSRRPAARAPVGSVQSGGETVILGSLDRSVIEAVIKRQLNAIRYCYQRELQKAPDLEGKLVIRFTIGPDGQVAEASVDRSTLDDPAVERCVSGRFLRMTFPAPVGGGVVIVRYPFDFQKDPPEAPAEP